MANAMAPTAACESKTTNTSAMRTEPRHGPLKSRLVFELPELLELILDNFSVQDLLRLRRTNKTFNNTITTSPTLLCAQFLRPVYPLGNSNEVPQLNPLLASDDASDDEDEERVKAVHVNGVHYRISRRRKDMATNPLPVIEQSDQGRWHLQLDVKRLSPSDTFPHQAYVSERMYLSRPVYDVHVRVQDHGCRYTTRRVKGGTLGEILSSSALLPRVPRFATARSHEN